MATHSGILAWRIPVDRGAWRATVHGVKKLDTTDRLSRHTQEQRAHLLALKKQAVMRSTAARK